MLSHFRAIQILALASLCVAGLAAHAEYRAFRLRISRATPPLSASPPPTAPRPPDGDQPAPPPPYREVVSTLDPLQYPGYYPVAPDETVTYTSTWMCKGRTSGKVICPDPKQARAPATPPNPSENSTGGQN